MKKISNLSEAEAVLGKFIPRKAVHAYTLQRMHALMDILGNPQDKIKVVHVAGTAGKTSTSYFIAKMLQLSGKTVGLTVSPHIDQVNERVQINGEPLNEAEFCRLLTEFLDTKGLQESEPTYFELLVAFAYWVFARKNVDYAVVEVGLGGLHDGTNVVSRADKVCVITDIGFDHVHILGDTLEKIAFQKAGIIQKHNAVLLLEQQDAVLHVIYDYAAQQNAKLFMHRQSESVPANLPLYQQRNWALAHDVYEYIADRDGLRALDFKKDQNWPVPGRMEVIGNFILDGAHNPSKFTALTQTLQKQYPHQKLTFIVGMIESKESYVQECIGLIAPLAEKVLCIPVSPAQDLPHASLDPQVIAKAATAAGIKTVTVSESITQAISDSSNEDVVVITGSLYLLGEAKAVLLNQ